MVSTLKHLALARRMAQARKRGSSPVVLIIELLGAIVVLAEISAALAQLLHLQESSAILNLASTALGGLIGLLVNPRIGGKVLGVESGPSAGTEKGNDIRTKDEA